MSDIISDKSIAPDGQQVLILFYLLHESIQVSLNSSNSTGSFSMADSNSFLSPYEIPVIAQENKYLGIFL